MDANPKPETDSETANVESDKQERNIGNDKLSPEMAAAVHAAMEGSDDEPVIAPEIGEKESGHEVNEDLETETPASADNELKEQLIRAVAEMDNLRKRHERDMSDARKYAVTGFARDLVSVVENLQLALQSITQEKRESDDALSNLAQGVEMTYNELLRAFSNHGIVRIDPVGEKFNHNHHQAVAQVESADVEPGKIVQVLQAGYIIHDRLLRPAMVTVAKGGEKSQAVDTEA